MCMKIKAYSVPMLFAIACLCGCTASKSPDNAIIQDGLVTAVDWCSTEVAINKIDIQQSLTENKTYNADIIAEVTIGDTTLSMPVSAEFVLYDQGWRINSCSWDTENYVILQFPDDEAIQEMVDLNEDLLEDYDEIITEGIEMDDDEINCQRRIKKNVNQYMDLIGNINTVWEFNISEGRWDISDKIEEVEYSLQDLNGTWIYGKIPDAFYSIEITNFSEDGFDISCPSANSNTIHVNKSSEPSNMFDMVYEGEGFEYNAYGSTSHGDKLTVGFYLADDNSSFQIHLHVPGMVLTTVDTKI